MKTGLVLEGGAMRGMYTAGVLDVLLENDIRADCIVGVSAGALFGVNYLSGQAGRAIRYNKRFNGDRNYLGILPLLREGNIVSTRYAYQEVPHRLDPFDDEAFIRSGVPFYAVVTDIANAQPEYVRIDSVFAQMEVLRASGSMPFVSRPVEIGGRKYLDGGISDSIPIAWMDSQGVDKMIVVLTQDSAYRKRKMSPALLHAYGLRYPAIARRLRDRHTEYNQTLDTVAQWEAEGRAFVFRPPERLTIGKTEKDPAKLQAVYDLGRKDAKSRMQELLNYLK